MSWSVTLSGPKKAVLREVADAILVFDKAFAWIENAEDDSTLSVNLNGYVSWNDAGEVTNSNIGFNVGETAPIISETSEPTPL